MLFPQAAPSGANITAAYDYEESIRYGFHSGRPQRRLSQALGVTPRAPVVIPAPRVVEPVARPAAVVQPARQAPSVPGADMWHHAGLLYVLGGACAVVSCGRPHE